MDDITRGFSDLFAGMEGGQTRKVYRGASGSTFVYTTTFGGGGGGRARQRTQGE
jgi:hypothetical protein